MKLLPLLVVILGGCGPVSAQSGPPFPGAEGSGATCEAGQKGAIIHVTSLADSGPGTLREAIETPGARIVHFKVAGEIELKTPLDIEYPNLMVDGSTAPGLVIISAKKETTGNGVIGIRTHDVCLRYLALYKGYNETVPLEDGDQGPGNLGLWDGCQRIVIDHCSLLWTQDENLTIYGDGNRDITIQWCLIAEPYAHHPTNAIVGPDNAPLKVGIDMHHNLFANSSHRNPLYYSVEGRFVNNLVYNWSWFAMGMPEQKNRVDIIHNIFKAGPLTEKPRREISVLNSDGQSLYLRGNRGPSGKDWSLVESIDDMTFEPQGRLADRAKMARQEPLPAPMFPITTHSLEEVEEAVLRDVGASKFRSADDARIIENYRKRTGEFPKR